MGAPAVALTDVMPNGLSMVYSFFDPAFLAQHPQLSVQLVRVTTVAEFYSHRVDCALLPGNLIESTLSGRELRPGRLVVVAAPSYIAKFGAPGRPVIVFAGDGAMQMNGLAELITIKHYWEEWDDPRLVVAVLHNNDLNQVTWEMRAMSGSPKFVESQRLPDVDYASFASSLGLRGITIEDPARLKLAWADALSADRPTVLDVHVDPNVPPIPPHATFEQMKDTLAALLAGDEDRWGIIVEGVKTKVQELVHLGD